MTSEIPNIPEEDLELKVFLTSEHEKEGTRDRSLRKYKEEFPYANIEEDEFDYTFKTNQTFKEVKQIIFNKTKFHPKMMSFGKWSYYDEKENMTYFESVNYKDTDTLYDSCFNQPYTETRYLYVIIDKNKNENHQMLNNIYKDFNERYEESNRKNTELGNENRTLKEKMNNYEKNMKNMENSYKNEIEKIENENSKKIEKKIRETRNEFENRLYIEKEKNKKEQEQLKGKIKNIEDTQKMEKEAEIKNEKEAESEFNKQLEEIKINFLMN